MTGQSDWWSVGTVRSPEGPAPWRQTVLRRTFDPSFTFEWREVVVPGAMRPRRVMGTSSSDVWVVGDDVDAFHFDGYSWQRIPIAGGTGFYVALFAESPSNVWVLANAGVFHWNGSAFREAGPLPQVPGSWWTNIWSGGPADTWVTGYGMTGAAAHWDGVSWSLADVGAEASYSVVYGTPSSVRLFGYSAPFCATAAALPALHSTRRPGSC